MAEHLSSSNAIHIRPADPADLEPILDILREGWAAIYRKKINGRQLNETIDTDIRPLYRGYLKEQIERHFMVATQGQSVKGFVCYGPTEGRLKIQAVYVKKEFERHGIGALLLYAAAQRMEEQYEPQTVAMHVCTDNDRASNFALAMGGRRNGTMTRHFMPGIDIVDQIIKWDTPRVLIDHFNQDRRFNVKVPVALNGDSLSLAA